MATTSMPSLASAARSTSRPMRPKPVGMPGTAACNQQQSTHQTPAAHCSRVGNFALRTPVLVLLPVPKPPTCQPRRSLHAARHAVWWLEKPPSMQAVPPLMPTLMVPLELAVATRRLRAAGRLRRGAARTCRGAPAILLLPSFWLPRITKPASSRTSSMHSLRLPRRSDG